MKKGKIDVDFVFFFTENLQIIWRILLKAFSMDEELNVSLYRAEARVPS